VDLSLVIPCYNEAPHLRESVDALLEVLEATRLEYELVFVDDVSKDETRAVLAELCATRPRCRAILHERNKGRGGAFKTGYRATTGAVTGFLDIDLEVAAHYVPPLVERVRSHGVDVATGHRHYLMSQTHAVHRIVLSRAYRLLLRLSLGCGVRDTETGCKFFRRATASDVVLRSESDGWFWDTEVMVRAALADLVIEERPVLFLRRWDKQSTVRLWHDIQAYLVELHRFRKKIGMSYLGKSPIYWTGWGYDLVMRLLYGRGLARTYADVAARVPAGASVVDLCCGTARLWRDHLAPRATPYLGLDFNGHLLLAARARGAKVKHFDVRQDELPRADCLTLVSSLYHFRRDAPALLGRMRRAARTAVIVSEPVSNHSAGRGPRAALAASLSNPGAGEYRERFTPPEFEALARAAGAREFVHAPGDRNALAIFPASP
jgi:glycosyltransferase involved in cell wall biosynthesis